MTAWREVTEQEFFKTMGPQDVHPTIVSRWPYTSLWKLRYGNRAIGKTEDHLPEGKALPQTRYYLPK